MDPVRDMRIITRELIEKDLERMDDRIARAAGKKNRAFAGLAKEKEVRTHASIAIPTARFTTRR